MLATTLTGVSGSNGITVSSDNVSIDLAGHSLIGVAGSLDGIIVSGARNQLSVVNGTVRNWGADGIDADSASAGDFSNLLLHDNGEAGLESGTRVQVTKVIARSNLASGITTGTIARVADCTATANGAVGISVGNGCSVERCVLSANISFGILVGAGNHVVGNSCDSHVGVAGIRATGIRNRIDGNMVSRNQIGIEIVAASTGNSITRNCSIGNTTAYSISAGNDAGPVTTAATATNPFGNISF